MRVPIRFCAAVAVRLAALACAGLVPFAQLYAAASGQNADLDTVLARLARNPRDVDALVAAGNAALAVGDTGAAVGFFTRAQGLVPGSARVMAGLAGAKVLAGDPLGGLGLFLAAGAGGAVLPPDRLSDRGLGYDLVGDQPRAQDSYRTAIAAGAGDEARRRLAMSLAISGDRRSFEATIRPLTDRNDRPAWRTRAFGLAALGDEEEAVQIAHAYLPANLANGLAPYLRYMRRLTRAQQAAAANLGQFPLPANIGTDDAAIVAWQQRTGVRQTLAAADAAPAAPSPEARPTGSNSRRHRAPPAAPAAAPQPPPVPTPSRVNVETAPVRLSANAELAPIPPALHPAPLPLVRAVPPAPPPAAPPPAPAVAPVGRPSGASFDLAQLSRSAPPPTPSAAPIPPVIPPAAPPVAPPVSTPKPAAPVGFSDAFASFGDARPDAAPARGAVDVRRLTAPPKPKPPPPPPPKLVRAPSRVWVQVGVGRSAVRLATDWRRMADDKPRLFRGKAAFAADWGRTHRLLAGPFADEDAAKAWLARIKPDHADAFVWISPAGQDVAPLGGE